MIRSQLCFLLLAIFTRLSFSAKTVSAQSVNFSCAAVPKSICYSGTQFKVYGKLQTTILNYTYCAPSAITCNISTISLNLQSCKIDYRNQPCPPKVCFIKPSYQICAKDVKCSSKFSTNYSCINCTIASCSKCYYQQTNDPFNPNKTKQTCFGNNCTQGFSRTTATYQPCLNNLDYFGQPCQCCVTTLQVARFCITNNDVLMRKQLISLFNFQSMIGKLLLSVIALIIAATL